MKLFVRVKTEEQLKQTLQIANVIICPADVLSKTQVFLDGKDLYIDLPDILRENRIEEFLPVFKDLLSRFPDAGLVIKNLDELGLLKTMNLSGRRIIADSFLYAYNKEAIQIYRDITESGAIADILFMASDELTDSEEANLFKSSGEKFIYKIYGRQCVMFTAQSFPEPKAFLRSDMGDDLIAVWEEEGYTTIYTRRPVSMIDKLPEINSDFILADFTTETGADISMIAASLDSAMKSRPSDNDSSGIAASLDPALKGRTSGTSSSGNIRGHHFKGID